MSSLWYVVFKKELKDIFRDKKTIITTIILPFVLFPLLFFIVGKAVKSSEEKVTKEVKIVYQGKDSSLKKFLSAMPNIRFLESKDYKEDVKNGTAYLAVVVEDDFDEKIAKDKQVNLNVIYDSESTNSQTAMEAFMEYIDTYKNEVVKKKLNEKGVDVSILNLIEVKDSPINQKENRGLLILTMLLPLYFIIYSVSGPMAAAVDLGAGEKERGTLEPLLTTQVNRMQLLTGKLLSIIVMGIIGMTTSLIGLFIGFSNLMNTTSSDGNISLTLSAKTMVLLFVVAVVLNMIFGAIEFAISVYARSFKEAQTYLSPITIVAFIAGYGTYMIDVKHISNIMFNIPIANMSFIIKEFVLGIYNPTHILITFAWALVYVLASLLFARYMYSREEVIFRT